MEWWPCLLAVCLLQILEIQQKSRGKLWTFLENDGKRTLNSVNCWFFNLPLPLHLYIPIIGKHLATACEVWAQEPQLPDPDGWPPAGKSTNCHAPGEK